jgi:enoyl-[acyl-carrier protein] reductase I
MTVNRPDWKSNENLSVGKGATVQEFTATVGNDRLLIDVAPWGEGHLRVNGREIAHINDQAFRSLKRIADRYLEEHPPMDKGKP